MMFQIYLTVEYFAFRYLKFDNTFLQKELIILLS